jgi:coniferyl-aldehyde dehydrogenase
MTTNTELNEIFKKQKEAFANNSSPSLKERIDRLQRLEAAMMKNRIAFQKTIREDFGAHSQYVTDLFETGGVLGRGRHLQATLEEWMRPVNRELNSTVHGSSTAKVIRQPKGVMGNMAPWNFPIECALVMVNDMLAAGNRVIVKGAELTPATSSLLEEVIKSEFDEDTLAVVNGDTSFSEYFSTMPWDHLTYTGGERVAKLVMNAASINLTPVTLELGGKNPTLFTNEGVCELLVERFLFNRVFKGGQVCTSPDYAMVPEEHLETWVNLAKNKWSEMYPNYIGHEDATGTINDHHFNRIMNYIDEAKEAGCEVISLNGEDPDESLRQIPMIIIINPDDSLSVMQEEIFGPVTAVKTYSNIDSAINYINSKPRPLAAYLVGREREMIQNFEENIISGGIGINVFGLQGAEPCLPFGGIGNSGMGCHSGHEGFLNYTHSKSVFECGDDSPLMASLKGPYGEITKAFSDAVFPDIN